MPALVDDHLNEPVGDIPASVKDEEGEDKDLPWLIEDN